MRETYTRSATWIAPAHIARIATGALEARAIGPLERSTCVVDARIRRRLALGVSCFASHCVSSAASAEPSGKSASAARASARAIALRRPQQAGEGGLQARLVGSRPGAGLERLLEHRPCIWIMELRRDQRAGGERRAQAAMIAAVLPRGGGGATLRERRPVIAARLRRAAELLGEPAGHRRIDRIAAIDRWSTRLETRSPQRAA